MKVNECRLCTNVIPPTGKPGRPKSFCAECESCHGTSIESAEWRYKRNHYLQASYGLTYAAFEDMFQAQGGLCDICCVQMSLEGSERTGRTCCVDHCHTSGNVRALLCLNCNQGLGKFLDDSEALERAAEYIRRHEGY